MRKNGEIHYSRFPSGESVVVRQHEKKLRKIDGRVKINIIYNDLGRKQAHGIVFSHADPDVLYSYFIPIL